MDNVIGKVGGRRNEEGRVLQPAFRSQARAGRWDDPPLSERGHQQAREVGEDGIMICTMGY